MFRYIVSFVSNILLATPSPVADGTILCKACPGSANWPTLTQWNSLNRTLSGHLLRPLPPASVCHPNQPNFDLETCKSTNWTDAATYANDPLGIICPNWSLDSCLPQQEFPCSGEGYPVYVVNATCPDHVAAGVNFARQHSLRLNVKGSGHDYLGRSTAPNSLSIWTKHVRGINFHDGFRPKGCLDGEAVPGATLGAGEDWGNLYAAAHERGLTFVGGTGDTIGLGGYLTGGGHSPLSAMLGLAVDQVLEMEVVMASGEIVIANEAQHSDLFWAMRGGGGATFGIMTSVTLKTFQDMPVASASVMVGAAPDSEAFWNFSTFIVSQSPRLQHAGVMGYCYLSPATNYNGNMVGGYLGVFNMPNGTVAELNKATTFLQEYIRSIPGVQMSFLPIQYPSLYAWYQVNKNVAPVGTNNAVGNRLLGSKALSNITALKATMRAATPAGTTANLNLIAGPGVWSAESAGGSNSVTPAWREAYIEYVVPISWRFRDQTAKDIQTHLLTDVYMEALRELAPHTGSYLNEGDVNETNFQEAFWGSNYPRLLSIKRRLDPYDLFWCAACVGGEYWREKDGVLCRWKQTENHSDPV